MRRVALVLGSLSVLGALATAAGCELLVGIKDKTEATGNAAGDAADLPCSQQGTNLFCDDFDSELEAGAGWLWDIGMGGGSIGFDTVHYVTAPQSALFMVPSGTASAQLGQNIGSNLLSGYQLDFDLRLDVPNLSAMPQLGVAQAYGTGDPNRLSFNYVVGPGDNAYIQYFEGAASTLKNVKLTQTPPPQKWTHIRMDYDATNGVSVIEDGTTIGASAAAAQGPPGPTSIIVGAVYSNPPGSAVTFEIDDVVLRGQ